MRDFLIFLMLMIPFAPIKQPSNDVFVDPQSIIIDNQIRMKENEIQLIISEIEIVKREIKNQLRKR